MNSRYSRSSLVRAPFVPRALTAAITVSLGCFAADASAAAYLVTTLANSGAGSLRNAVIQANANPGLDTITFSGAAVAGTITLASLISITDEVTITGPGQAALIISGGGITKIFAVEIAAGLVTLSDMTLQDAYTDANGPSVVNFGTTGGAISSYWNTTSDPGGGGLTLSNVRFKNNIATATGGNNSNGGGAIASIQGQLTVNNCVFDNNTASGMVSNLLLDQPNAHGGAIAMYGGRAFITNSAFINNNAQTGGAIGTGYSYSGDLDIVGSTFTNNKATVNGGAIGTGYSRILIDSTRFADNSAGASGGAIHAGSIYDPQNTAFGYGFIVRNGSVFDRNHSDGATGSIFVRVYTGLAAVSITDSDFDGGTSVTAPSINGLNAGIPSVSSDEPGQGGVAIFGREVLVERNNFRNNREAGGAGALSVTVGSDFSTPSVLGTVAVKNNLFSGNVALPGPAFPQLPNYSPVVTPGNSSGGGLSVFHPVFNRPFYPAAAPLTSLDIANNTFSGNTATQGGGLNVDVTNTGYTTTVRNNTFTQNTANQQGGAINFGTWSRTAAASPIGTAAALPIGKAAAVPMGKIDLVSNLFVSNTASVNPGAAVTITHSGDSSVNATQSFNFFSGLAPVSLAPGGAAPTFNAADSIINNASANLGPLQNNGGRTFTHAVPPTSPAVVGGKSLTAPTTLAFDQRGASFARTSTTGMGTTVTFGAFQTPPQPLIPQETATPVPTLSAWGQGGLALLLAGAAWVSVAGRRRRQV